MKDFKLNLTKRIGLVVLVSICILMNTSAAQAQLFSQDFSSSTVVADYVSATPNNGQFNAISSSGAGTVVSINGGTLQFARTANAGSFSRTTDFSPTPSSIIYRIDITVSGNTAAATSAAIFQVGSGFGTANSPESNANTYARFGINLSATAGCFSIRDITNGTTSAEFCNTQTITWVLNNTGAALSYNAPDSTIQTVANDTADLYVGTTLVLNDVPVQTATQVITDLKFAFVGGTGTIQLDNVQINVLAPTAAGATIGGRITSTNGRGIRNVRIMLAGGSLTEPIYATSTSFGYYQFPQVPSGETYVLQILSKKYVFDSSSIVINLTEDLTETNFTGQLRGLVLTGR
jgi:hypothetical protein